MISRADYSNRFRRFLIVFGVVVYLSNGLSEGVFRTKVCVVMYGICPGVCKEIEGSAVGGGCFASVAAPGLALTRAGGQPRVTLTNPAGSGRMSSGLPKI